MIFSIMRFNQKDIFLNDIHPNGNKYNDLLATEEYLDYATKEAMNNKTLVC